MEINDVNSNISIEEAKIMGFFFGDGSCGIYNCKSGCKSRWALNNYPFFQNKWIFFKNYF